MIYVIMGPTGSGKTDVANKLASHLNCPLINADAFQIYKEMNIGTNKISKDDELYKSYYMLDIISPEENYSVKEYQDNARKILNELLIKHKNVIIVGGTGLYIKALLYDYEFNNEESQIDGDLLTLSNEELHKLLESLDIEESKKIHVNNRKRLLRAISLIRHSDINKTEMISKQNHQIIYNTNNLELICINPDREVLYERINNRVKQMIDNGLIQEVEQLTSKYELSVTASQGIGYKEVISYLDNEISLEECIDLISKRTRNYAKRQLTFFKHQFENVKYFSSFEETLKYLIKK